MRNATIEFYNNDTIEEGKEKLKSIADVCRDKYSADDFIVISSVCINNEGNNYIICNIYRNFIEADSMIRAIGDDPENLTSLSYFNLQEMKYKMIARKQMNSKVYDYINNYAIFDLNDEMLNRIVEQLTNTYSNIIIHC